MKLTVSKSELYEKLKMTGKVVGPSKTMPILEKFLFEIVGGQLTITGSDSSGSIQAKVNLVSADQGATKFVVDRTLFNALAELPDQPIEMVVDKNNRITVNYHNGQFEIQGSDADGFPLISMNDENTVVQIDRRQMIEGLKTVIPFVGTSDLRPVMTGVYMDSKEGNLTYVATDAHVLACREYDNELPDFSAIIPTKAVKVMLSILAEYQEDMVQVTTSTRTISVVTDSYTLTYRLLEGRYPNYRNVIPKSHEILVTVDRGELLSLIKRVSVFSNANSKLLKLDINPGKVQVFAQDIDFSISATETLSAEVDGGEIEIGFNAYRMADLLTAADCDQCEIKLIDPSRAGIINPVGVEGVTLLIMPMTINN